MNLIRSELRAIDPSIFIYGEGWTAGASPIADSLRALKVNTAKLDQIAVFSDDLRDGLKGSVFDVEDRGFVSGKLNMEESIKFGIVAATEHDQVNYEAVNYSNAYWSPGPTQTISYVSCHDNNTLYDKLKLSVPNANENTILRMHQLAQTIVFTSQGVPFLHAGTEFLRTKNGIENSYKSPDSINQIDWERKKKYEEVFDYYRNLIALRKSHPAFRMKTTSHIQENLRFINFDEPLMVGFSISNNANGDEWSEILVYHNANDESRDIDLPSGDWKLILKDFKIDSVGSVLATGSLSLPAISSTILAR